MMKLKKIITMVLAAMVAVSAMSISAFAEEVSNNLVATIPTADNSVVKVYEKDLTDDGYSVNCGEYTVTVGKEERQVTPRISYTPFINGTSPGQTLDISGSNTQYLSFNPSKGVVQCSPKFYTPQLGRTTLCYHFGTDKDYGTKVQASVYLMNKEDSLDNKQTIANLYLYYSDDNRDDEYYISVNGLVNGNLTYATVTNWTYNGTATGTCMVTN